MSPLTRLLRNQRRLQCRKHGGVVSKDLAKRKDKNEKPPGKLSVPRGDHPIIGNPREGIELNARNEVSPTLDGFSTPLPVPQNISKRNQSVTFHEVVKPRKIIDAARCARIPKANTWKSTGINSTMWTLGKDA